MTEITYADKVDGGVPSTPYVWTAEDANMVKQAMLSKLNADAAITIASNLTAAQLTTANAVYAATVIRIESDTKKVKFCDGVTAWSALPYVSADATGKVSTGAIATGLATEMAAARAAYAGQTTAQGFDAAGTPIVHPTERAAFAAPVDLQIGGASIVTAQAIFDHNATRTIAPVSGVISVKMPTLTAGEEALPRNFYSEISADTFLKFIGGTTSAEVSGVGYIFNAGVAAARLFCQGGLVAGPTSKQSVLDATVALGAWEDGSLAARTLQPGETRAYAYRARNGMVRWTPLPLSLMSAWAHLEQERRQFLNGLNLPLLSGNQWYSAIICTMTNLDAAAAPVACDPSLLDLVNNAPGGIEQLGTYVLAATCSGRLEGIVFRGGNFTFDNSAITGDQRFVAVRKHNYRPANVAGQFYTPTWRPKSNGGSLTQLWPDATIPGGEEVDIIAVQLSRGTGPSPITPRAELVGAPFAQYSSTATHQLGAVSMKPVSAWAAASTDGITNSEGLGVVIPMKRRV